MKVEVKRIRPDEEENAVIRVAELTDSIRSAVDLLENQCGLCRSRRKAKP